MTIRAKDPTNEQAVALIEALKIQDLTAIDRALDLGADPKSTLVYSDQYRPYAHAKLSYIRKSISPIEYGISIGKWSNGFLKDLLARGFIPPQTMLKKAIEKLDQPLFLFLVNTYRDLAAAKESLIFERAFPSEDVQIQWLSQWQSARSKHELPGWPVDLALHGFKRRHTSEFYSWILAQSSRGKITTQASQEALEMSVRHNNTAGLSWLNQHGKLTPMDWKDVLVDQAGKFSTSAAVASALMKQVTDMSEAEISTLQKEIMSHRYERIQIPKINAMIKKGWWGNYADNALMMDYFEAPQEDEIKTFWPWLSERADLWPKEGLGALNRLSVAISNRYDGSHWNESWSAIWNSIIEHPSAPGNAFEKAQEIAHELGEHARTALLDRWRAHRRQQQLKEHTAPPDAPTDRRRLRA